MNDKWIICLGGSASKIPIIKTSKEMNLKCCVVDINPKCFSKQFADLFLNYSIIEHEKIIYELTKKEIKNKVVMIFAYTSLREAQKSALKIAKKMNLPYCSKKILEYAWNKNEFKKLCIQNNIQTPQHIVTKNKQKIKKFLLENKKIICKPSSGVGSECVTLVKNIEDVDALNLKSPQIIEKFIGEKLFSVCGLISGNKIVFQLISKKHVRHNTQTTNGFSPINNTKLKKSIEYEVKKIIDILAINNSFFSFDIIEYNQKIYFIDFGILLDVEVDRLIEAMGINIFELFIKNILKIPSNTKKIKSKISIAFLYAQKNGKIEKIPNIKEKCIIKYSLNKNSNCVVGKVVSDKIGHVICEKNWDETRKIADNIEQKIMIK